MKERPILFSGPMVRAILDGKKTMTRRVVKPQPVSPPPLLECYRRYGEPGDRLWVRETFRPYDGEDDSECGRRSIEYRADHPDSPRYKDMPWRPSIFMGRKESRITLEIVSVRLEKLQEITEADCIREGIEENFDGDTFYPRGYYFKELWDSINGKKYPWESNPWVWVIEFKKL